MTVRHSSSSPLSCSAAAVPFQRVRVCLPRRCRDVRTDISPDILQVFRTRCIRCACSILRMHTDHDGTTQDRQILFRRRSVPHSVSAFSPCHTRPTSEWCLLSAHTASLPTCCRWCRLCFYPHIYKDSAQQVRHRCLCPVRVRVFPSS